MRSGSRRRDALLALLSTVPLLACQQAPTTPFEWETVRPETTGLSGDLLRRATEEVQSRSTSALLIVHNDRIVHEWYAPGSGPDSRHPTSSVQKALVGGLGLALLAEDGLLGLDEPASKYVSAWSDDPRRRTITLRQLATHSSGLEDAEEDGLPHDQLAGWKGEFWERDSIRTPIHLAIHETPLRDSPGERSRYSNPGYAVLSYVFATALAETRTPDLSEYLATRLFEPIGLEPDEWQIGYGRPFQVDGLRVWASWGGGRFTARALARIGRLLLRRGEWNGERLLSAAMVDELTAYRGTPISTPEEPWRSAAPGLGFSSNEFGVWPALPRNAFVSAGASHRLLIVVPSLELVIVRLGDWMADPAEVGYWGAVNRHLLEPLIEAWQLPPIPWSREFIGAWFDPVDHVVCKAEGSDNWPITWGADGALYAAYGDGWGFRPPLEEKLSLGFARVTGVPPEFRGANIRSPDGERRGDGPSGPKASGMLEVDGVLYMWVRNLDNARLAWSEDGGKSWEWGFRFEESFGSPSFLQFGPGYADARDEYVYTYSQDGPSAYESDDRVVLARVARDAVREQDAYEFYAGADAGGQPVWEGEISARQGVLSHENGVRRIEVVHHRPTDRYLMALGFDGSTLELMGTGTEGAWGLFEAPEPWGPWAGVYMTPRWDIADTHSYRLPTKWIGESGERMYLVFSGREYRGRHYDAFCVRGFRVTRPFTR